MLSRTDELNIYNLKVIKDYLSDITEQNVDDVYEIARNSLNGEELL